MAEAEADAASPEAPSETQEEEQWLAPPVGGETKKYDPGKEKVSQQELDFAVDKVTNGIKHVWHLVANYTQDPVWEHSEEDMWGYSVLVGWVIKKYAKKLDLIILAVGVMSILTTETMKFSVYAAHQKQLKGVGKGGMPAAIPAGALA